MADYKSSNIIQLFREMGEQVDCEYCVGNQFDSIKTLNSVWPNQVLNFKSAKSLWPEMAGQIRADQAANKLPAIIVGEANSEEKLNRFFLEQDYHRRTWTAMSINPSNLSFDTKGQFSVKEFGNDEKLEDWLAVVKAELMLGGTLNSHLFESLNQSPNVHFLALYKQAKIVSTVLLYTYEEHAGIYLLATRKEQRSKGFAKALMQEALRRAREKSCSSVWLQATEAGYSLYKRLGFKDAGKIPVYKFKGDANS
ncbi:MAG: GNAT family N-acetyltransferase [Bacteroidetes bacterium]|nr:GNAT family N-acetyltransferase [Bacteroidota bacterium]